MLAVSSSAIMVQSQITDSVFNLLESAPSGATVYLRTLKGATGFEMRTSSQQIISHAASANGIVDRPGKGLNGRNQPWTANLLMYTSTPMSV